LRLTSGGDKGRRGGGFGDLYVIIHVKDHPQFVREGETIHLRQPISFSMAGLGGELMVSTVDGPRLLKIPAGTQTGTTIVMREIGVPRFNMPQRRGDQIVHIAVETPTKLSAEEKKLLEQLAEVRNEQLTVSKEEREAAEKTDTQREEPAAEGRKSGTKSGAKSGRTSKDKDKGADKEREKEQESDKEESIFDKIVDVFRPKNGEDK
jgi:DnaJ-class molecular chaperone